VRGALRRILDEDWIVVLGSGIALGYTLLRLAEAVATTIIMALESQSEDQLFASDRGLFALRVGDHVIDFGSLVGWVIASAIVLGVVAFAVSRLQRPADAPP
jgi:hypothetical protein